MYSRAIYTNLLWSRTFPDEEDNRTYTCDEHIHSVEKKPQREKKRKHVNTFTKPIQTTKKQKIRRNYYTLKVFSCEHQHMSSRIEKVRETCDKSKKKRKQKMNFENDFNIFCSLVCILAM